MERLWDWHQKGDPCSNIDVFVTDLKKINAQKGVLLKHQMLGSGDISQSVSVMLVMAKNNPEMTNSVVEAALEMNKYLNSYYAKSTNQVLAAEKLMVPAMLEALESWIQINVKNSNLIAKAKLLVFKSKKDIEKDNHPTRRNIYDEYVSAYGGESISRAVKNSMTKSNIKPRIREI